MTKPWTGTWAVPKMQHGKHNRLQDPLISEEKKACQQGSKGVVCKSLPESQQEPSAARMSQSDGDQHVAVVGVMYHVGLAALPFPSKVGAANLQSYAPSCTDEQFGRPPTTLRL